MEIVQERLEREYDLDLITTAPTVVYEIVTTRGETLHVDNPADLPAANLVAVMREPIVLANILVPQTYLGAVITLCNERRGIQTCLNISSSSRIFKHSNATAAANALPLKVCECKKLFPVE